jgi:hypothetical protein
MLLTWFIFRTSSIHTFPFLRTSHQNSFQWLHETQSLIGSLRHDQFFFVFIVIHWDIGLV